jgi:hypothetical protein
MTEWPNMMCSEKDMMVLMQKICNPNQLFATGLVDTIDNEVISCNITRATTYDGRNISWFGFDYASMIVHKYFMIC